MGRMGGAALGEALARLDGIAELIEREATAAEELGQLTAPVIEALEESGLLHALVPKELGGSGLTLPEAIELYRAVAQHDGSTGWTFAILAGSALLGRLIEPECFAEMLAAGAPTVAGSLNPLAARAEPIDGGFRFNGTVPYASGCHHARWLLINAWVHRDGAKSFVDGVPEFVAAIAPIERATIHDTWSTTGMRATGSDDCSVEDLDVPAEWTFSWPNAVPRFSADAWAAMPLLVQIGSSLAPSAVGAARHARDEFIELSGAKRPLASFDVLADRGYAHVAVGEAEGLLLAAEDTLAAAANDIWRQAEQRREFTVDDRARQRARTVTAVELACRSVDVIHGVAGMTSARTGTALERAWRDVHTASQHVNLNVARFETIGRIVLGRDPGSPVI
jgi:alkylation response protein AidB-like acyl-CoA dehydrogenase